MSRGYQQNFASPDKRVAILNARTGHVTDSARPIKSNFRERGFTTFLNAGVPNGLLEKAFMQVEKRVLDRVRTVGAVKSGAEEKADVANLFAVHLVRSPSFKAFHRQIGDRFRSESVPEFASREELSERFAAFTGRPPNDGEFLPKALKAYDEMAADPMSLVVAMARQHDAIAEMLNDFHLQTVEIGGASLPGFAIGDTPVVHARPSRGLYGFRDRLAIGDSDLIIGPLTRTTAACFSARRLSHVTLTTRRRIDAINAIFLRAAADEVACHPDDAKAMRQTYTRLDRLPPSIATGR